MLPGNLQSPGCYHNVCKVKFPVTLLGNSTAIATSYFQSRVGVCGPEKECIFFGAAAITPMQQLTGQATIIITGAYGSGKTECALALAAHWAASEAVTLVDLDFVNPYFRAQEHAEEMHALGVRVIAPEAHVAPIDAPALPPAARQAMVHPDGRTIVDLGGDANGAVVIGQFAPALSCYDCWGVVNFARPTTPTPAQAAAVLQEIITVTRLTVTGLISNTHFGPQTTVADVLNGLAQARELAVLLRAPVVLACAPAWLALPPLPVPVLAISPRLLRPWQIKS